MLPFTKSLTLLISLTFALSLGLASTANAKVIKGTPKNDVLVGTPKADSIDGKAGNDKISGKAGKDKITGGKGKDKINAGAGDDTIKVKDGAVDTVVCGAGKDTVLADATDKLAADCELPPVATPTPTPTPTPAPTVVITMVVTGSGSVTSAPAGINCGLICAGAFTAGSTVTLSATPGAGYVFAGWAGACSGTSTCVTTADTSKGVAAVFIPQWSVTAGFDGNGSGTISSSTAGIACPSDCSELVNDGDSITLTASATAGSTFTGWAGGGCTGTGSCVVTPSTATEVTAAFELITHTLSASVAGSGSGSVSSSPAGISCGLDCNEAYLENTVVTLTAAANVGSTFTGWSGGGCSGTGTCVVTMSAAASVTATFTINGYSLNVSKTGTGSGTITSSPAGIDCGGVCISALAHGTVVTLTASPSAGSTFTGWSGGDCTGTGSCVVTMTAAASVTANFTLLSYTLTATKAGTGTGTITSAPAGINCGIACSQSFDHGTQVTLTAASGPGSSFAGWSGGGCTGTGTCVVTMSAAQSVTAAFTQLTHTLTQTRAGTGTGTITSSPAGINCGIDCSETFNQGTVVTLTASPAIGSTFSGWSGGGCTGTGSCVVTINSATSVTATFTINSYTLTQNRAGTGTGTITSSPAGINCGVDCSEAYNHGTVVTLTAAVSPGSTFVGWTGPCSGTGTCVVTMSAATTVTAVFSNTNVLTAAKAGTGSGTVTSSPAGINCGADCSESYSNGTMVTFTATASLGSVFSGWSGACTGTGSCVVTVSAAATVTATFTMSFFLVDVTKSGTGTGTVTSSPSGINCGADCSEAFLPGIPAVLTATPTGGSTFTGWSGGGCSGTGTCTIANTNATVNAQFTAP